MEDTEMTRRKISFLISLALILSLILSGCSESSQIQANENYKKAKAALEVYNYIDAKYYLDQWEAENVDAYETAEYRQIYDAIVQMYKDLDIEPYSGYEFKRNIDYLGGCMFSVSSAHIPSIVYVTNTSNTIEVEFYVRKDETGTIFLPPDEYVVHLTRGDVLDEFGNFWHYSEGLWHEAIDLNVNYINGTPCYDIASIDLN